MEPKGTNISASLTASEQEDGEARRRRYNKAVRQARLVAILLTSVKFSANRGVDWDGDFSSFNMNYNGEVSRLHFDAEKGALFARIEWDVNIKCKRKSYAKCVAEYDVIYNGFSADCTDVVDTFAESVARPASYAYFRSLFSTLDWGAELRLPPLPVFKVQPKV